PGTGGKRPGWLTELDDPAKKGDVPYHCKAP
ncbi:hypothetical protein PA598K_02808, partial [Paenibacillus sp. 598K]